MIDDDATFIFHCKDGQTERFIKEVVKARGCWMQEKKKIDAANADEAEEDDDSDKSVDLAEA